MNPIIPFLICTASGAVYLWLRYFYAHSLGMQYQDIPKNIRFDEWILLGKYKKSNFPLDVQSVFNMLRINAFIMYCSFLIFGLAVVIDILNA